MKAGKLRNRVKVYRQNLAKDGCGGFDETFSQIGTIWASVTPRQPATDERYVDRHLELVQSYMLKSRYYVGFPIITKDIFIFRGEIYRIEGESTSDERRFNRFYSAEKIEGDEIEFAGMYDQVGLLSMYSQDGKNRMFSQAGT